MGVRGSGLATVLAQTISTVFVLRYFFSGKSYLKIRRKYLKLDKQIVSKIFALGSAQCAMELATSIVGAVLNISLAKYGGDVAISGMGIVTSVQIFPGQIVDMFNSHDAGLVDFTVYALRVFLMMLPIIGVQAVGANYFMAVGKPKHSAILSLSRQFLLLIPAVLYNEREAGAEPNGSGSGFDRRVSFGAKQVLYGFTDEGIVFHQVQGNAFQVSCGAVDSGWNLDIFRYRRCSNLCA